MSGVEAKAWESIPDGAVGGVQQRASDEHSGAEIYFPLDLEGLGCCPDVLSMRRVFCFLYKLFKTCIFNPTIKKG